MPRRTMQAPSIASARGRAAIDFSSAPARGLSRLAIDLNHFQTGPVRAEGEVPLSVRTLHGIGIDRVIVVRTQMFPRRAPGRSS